MKVLQCIANTHTTNTVAASCHDGGKYIYRMCVCVCVCRVYMETRCCCSCLSFHLAFADILYLIALYLLARKGNTAHKVIQRNKPLTLLCECVCYCCTYKPKVSLHWTSHTLWTPMKDSAVYTLLVHQMKAMALQIAIAFVVSCVSSSSCVQYGAQLIISSVISSIRYCYAHTRIITYSAWSGR